MSFSNTLMRCCWNIVLLSLRWHKLSAGLFCRQLPLGQTTFHRETLSSWQVELIIKTLRHCYLKLGSMLHRRGWSTVSTGQVRWRQREYLKCLQWIEMSLEASYIDLISFDYLLLIKLFIPRQHRVRLSGGETGSLASLVSSALMTDLKLRASQ